MKFPAVDLCSYPVGGVLCFYVYPSLSDPLSPDVRDHVVILWGHHSGHRLPLDGVFRLLVSVLFKKTTLGS